MAGEDVGGIALDFNVDTTGFSAGIARMREELNGLKAQASRIEMGVVTRGPGGTGTAIAGGRGVNGGFAVGVGSGVPGSGGVSPLVSPRFQVSASSVRQLRTDINAQMRALQAGGEAIPITVKLGRVPYAAMRQEISTGIGDVTIRGLRISPEAIAGALRQVSAAVIATSAPAAGIPRRATGGPASRGQDIIVGDGGRAEVFRPTESGRILPNVPHAAKGTKTAYGGLTRQQLNFTGNLRQAAARLTPEHIEGGKAWYRDAERYGRSTADQYGMDHGRALGILAALSAGTSWEANKTKYERILKANAAGQPFPYTGSAMNLDAHKKAYDILTRAKTPAQAFATSPKVGQFHLGISGDADTLTLDRWATRTASRGALDQPGRGRGRIRMERSYKKVGAEVGLKNAEFQAALWLLEKDGMAREEGGGVGDSYERRASGFKAAGLTSGKASMAQRLLRRAAMSERENREDKLGMIEGYAAPHERAMTVRGRLRSMLGIHDPQAELESHMAEYQKAVKKNDKFSPFRMAHLQRSISSHAGTLPGTHNMKSPLEGIDKQLEFMRKFPAPPVPLTREWGKDYNGQPVGGGDMPPGMWIRRRTGEWGSEVVNEHEKPEHMGDDNGPYIPNRSLKGYQRGALGLMGDQDRNDPGLSLFSRNARGGKIRGGFCSTCGTGMANPMTHRSTAKHIANARGKSRGSGSWMKRGYSNYGASDEDAEYERQAADAGFVGSPDWPHRWSGGRAEAYRQTIANGGGTFDPAGRSPSRGYAIGRDTNGIVDQEDRLGFIRQFRGAKKAGAPYVGTWLHEGQIHVDPVDVLTRKREAKRLAKQQGQLAIFDLKRLEEIDTRAQGGPARRGGLPRGYAVELYTGQGDRMTKQYAKEAFGNKNVLKILGAPSGHVGIEDVLTAQVRHLKSQQIVATAPFSYDERMDALHPEMTMVDPEHRRKGLATAMYTKAERFSGRPVMPSGSQTMFGKALWSSPDRPFGKQYGKRPLSEHQQTLLAEDERQRQESIARHRRIMEVRSQGGVGNALVSALQESLGEGTAALSLSSHGAMRDAGPLNRRMQARQFEDDRKRGIINRMRGAYGKEPMAKGGPIGLFDESSPRRIKPTKQPIQKGSWFTPIELGNGGWGVWSDFDDKTMGYQHGRKDAPGLSKRDAARMARELNAHVDGPNGTPDGVDEIAGRWLSGRHGMKAMAGGGPSDKGLYIVNEIGKEKFVPKEAEHLIPTEVAAQIPGGGGLAARLARARGEVPAEPEAFKPAWMKRSLEKDMGRSRASGGPIDIEGYGPKLWQAPGDGWIIPARLANKIPHFAGGGYVREDDGTYTGPRGGKISQAEGRRREQAELDRKQQITDQQTAQFERRLAEVRTVRQAQLRSRNLRSEIYNSIPTDLSPGGVNQAEVNARIAQGANRGLTGRAAAGGAAAFFLGGGASRRRALAESQAVGREYTRLSPERGRDTIEALNEQIIRLEDHGSDLRKTLSGLDTSTVTGARGFRILSKELKQTEVTTHGVQDRLVHANELQQRQEKALQKAQGGAARNFAAVTAAGFAFNIGMTAVNDALGLAAKAAAPVVDQLSGFTATSQRATKDLAEKLPESGTVSTLFARAGTSAGLSAGATDFLQNRLGASVTAKAGANAAGQSSELFRAALGSGAPSGLLGGTGGLFGSGFLAENLGGQKGFAEQIVGDIAVSKGQSGTVGLGGSIVDNFGKGANLVGGGLQNAGKALGLIEGEQQDYLHPLITIGEKEVEVQKELLKNFNEAVGRGDRSQGGTGAAATLADVGIGSAQAQQVLNTAGIDDYTKKMAEAGVVLQDTTGKALTSVTDINKAWATASLGFTLPDRETFARQSAQQLAGQEGATVFRGEETRRVDIPGQLGQQVLAQPFMDAFTGIADASKVTIADLKTTNDLQSRITAQARAGVELQAQRVDQNLGTAQGNEFRSLMVGGAESVEGYGMAIAALNEQMANRQAQASFIQYKNQIRLINRGIGDALGLLGRGGGSNVGRLERQQFTLGRESQQLGFASAKLQRAADALSLAMNQREINFGVAIAGFQAPGVTGEERAARIAEAKLQAEYQQKQQDISVSQYGIGGQQLGISQQQFAVEGALFTAQAERQLDDLTRQKAIAEEQFAIEQEQIATQKRIAALGAAQAQVQSRAQSLFADATNNFDARLAVAASYTAQFGGTMASAIDAVRRAIIRLNEVTAPRSTNTGFEGNPGKAEDDRRATGGAYITNGPTNVTFGEAGTEMGVFLRNPRPGQLSQLGGGGGGGQITVVVDVHDNNVRDDADIDALTRKITDGVKRELSREASLLGMAS